ncbi:hypothetical protein PF005_g30043 [Phytophthora fragariae]|uniref:RNase H type-1 domain-containing protein n=1 Tax=Phytophthora fragariae TaxID=53985 RepID=A0A6A4B2P4_9STRA|nr:hypothetical protein PF009_g11820 [Phytophthora fragariae]KAE8952182.1 hypothetical protein PF011_g32767 [Phytophthora fragariae]KAE9054473.1 hypothetical protein PF007_g32621 [Phytophthora fragariae]KAE9164259.1 hypothetical protein PF004_g29886 [Phytophthora fragariae]KAE9164418.1 hypothetical protein PF005_g30043 [Phytophthora fragariae]
MIQHKEHNSAAQALARMAQKAGHDMEWREHELLNSNQRWEGVKGYVCQDVKLWLQEHAKSIDSEIVEATV